MGARGAGRRGKHASGSQSHAAICKCMHLNCERTFAVCNGVRVCWLCILLCAGRSRSGIYLWEADVTLVLCAACVWCTCRALSCSCIHHNRSTTGTTGCESSQRAREVEPHLPGIYTPRPDARDIGGEKNQSHTVGGQRVRAGKTWPCWPREEPRGHDAASCCGGGAATSAASHHLGLDTSVRSSKVYHARH